MEAKRKSGNVLGDMNGEFDEVGSVIMCSKWF